MNKNIINTEIQIFINENINSNISDLLLKGTAFENVDTKEIVEQIQAKNKCKDKLTTWFNTPNIYYPNKLNIEQTSSEITANYKANLIEGKSIIDMTGGFGVDSYYFSKRFESVTHCEINQELSKIVKHNYNQLNVENISTISEDGFDYLKTSDQQFDWIYVDPSRRHETKGKVFFLNDCLPNIPENLDLLFKHSKHILIKTSPLLDISVGIGELKHVKSIHVVAVNNEVKELLWILESSFNDAISIETINLKNVANEYFEFTLEDEKLTEAKYNIPLTYLYEPNAAILKSGGFHSVSEKLGLFKLHKHSHLYTSDQFIEQFPGRQFKIESVLPYNKKEIKKLNLQKANITTRNFPETVKQLRKKFSIKDGGNSYLFFTTNKDDNKIVIATKKA